MNLSEFCKLYRGCHVIWRPTREHGIVQSRFGDTAWVKWDSGQMNKLVAMDDAYNMEFITQSMRAKLERTHRLARYRDAMESLKTPDIEPPHEQERILKRIADLRAAKRAAEGAKVVMFLSEDDEDDG